VTDWQRLIGEVNQNATLLVLDSARDGLTQIAEAVANSSNIDAIHIISHGSSGSLLLGSTTLDSSNLSDYETQLTTIGNALTETGDLLLYGCNVAQGDVGQAFIQQLAIITSADVAASTDLTGGANQGGDWILEANTGSIESTTLNIGNDYNSTLNYSSNPNYDLAVAADLVGLSVASYLTGEELKTQVAKLGWTFLQELHITSLIPLIDASAVIVERTLNGKSEMAIAFRGTQKDMVDWLTDFSPYGFSNYYKALRPEIEAYIIQAVHARYDNIYITGHSLGGAATQIAMIDMLEPTNLSVWIDPLLGGAAGLSPLQIGDRFLDDSPIVFSADDWSWLRSHLHGVTIGAPSISIDAPSRVLGEEEASRFASIRSRCRYTRFFCEY
jgi:hypothetical protein